MGRSLAALLVSGLAVGCSFDAEERPPAISVDVDGSAPDAQRASLRDRGLVTRYFIDEAGVGRGPTVLLDAADEPLPMTLEYGDELRFGHDIEGHRALQWTIAGQDSRASAGLVAGTKLQTALDGSQTATIEVVISIAEAVSTQSRISHIGVGSESGRFTLASDDNTTLQANWNHSIVATWPVDLIVEGRIVVHLVADTTRATADDRLRLFVDGLAVTRLYGNGPERNDAIVIPDDHSYVLGNREIGGRTFRGRLYYAALYSTALDAEEITNNAAFLANDDDAAH